eukprot:CAMPEP_0116014986 /NCGR_PEP_ID=MMETSP0321-20121206/6577_1 /TAXON_ID=163516 /ORGANISM="Leptocylindrus danicus var. danicus, Strain B650" /LENGTH=671 /DNA_ID=CAMNT_0003484689 /DNA_START=14 /DNA_END=2029 /DNA_ORIENTATION=+
MSTNNRNSNLTGTEVRTYRESQRSVVSAITTNSEDFYGGVVDDGTVTQPRRQNMDMLQSGSRMLSFRHQKHNPSKRHVLCKGCRVPTHKLNLFTRKQVPLNNDRVRNGRCILCVPLLDQGINTKRKTHGASSTSGANSVSSNRASLPAENVTTNGNVSTPNHRHTIAHTTSRIEEETKQESHGNLSRGGSGSAASASAVSQKGKYEVTITDHVQGNGTVLRETVTTTRDEQGNTIKEIIRETLPPAQAQAQAQAQTHVNEQQQQQQHRHNDDVAVHNSSNDNLMQTSNHGRKSLADNSTIASWQSEDESTNSDEEGDNVALDINQSLNILETLDDLPDIVDLMVAYQEQPVVLEEACKRIQKLASDDSFLSGAAMVGLVQHVVEALDSYPDIENLQEKGCIALYYLSESGDDNKEGIIAANGILTIVNAMRSFVRNGTLQNWAVGALASVATNSVSNKMMIGVLNGIDVIVQAMQGHTERIELQVSGLKALWSLTVNSADNCARVASAGGIESIVCAMNTHRGYSEIAEYACGAIWSLVCSDDVSILKQLGRAGVAKAIIEAMNSQKDLIRLQEKGCATLAQLSTLTAETYAIVDNGGIEAIVQSMLLYPESFSVQEAACNTLKALAKISTKNRQMIVNAGGVDVMFAAFDTFQQIAQVHEETASLLMCSL